MCPKPLLFNKVNFGSNPESILPSTFVGLIFGNCFLETDHRCYQAQPSPIPPNTQLDLISYTPIGVNESCKIDEHSNSNSIGTNLVVDDIWILYFDSSRTQDGSRAGCILIDPYYKKYILSCHLELECTNNTF